MNTKKFISRLHWCKTCQVYAILCEFCKNSSCNCGSCSKCLEEFREFNQIPQEVWLKKDGLPTIGMTKEEMERIYYDI